MDECEIEIKNDYEIFELYEVINTYTYCLEDSAAQINDVLLALDKTIPTLNHRAKDDAVILRSKLAEAIEKLQDASVELRAFTDKVGFTFDGCNPDEFF